MAESSTLGSAQVQFLNEHLALIHIPLGVYHVFLDPILKLLFHDAPSIDELERDENCSAEKEGNGEGKVTGADSISKLRKPAFINISVTPVECSIACSRELADLYFVPLMERVNLDHDAPDATSEDALASDRVMISKDDYTVMQVEGQGLDACRRVLDLTSPLAMAGISIFFVSTYFSDYILFPIKARDRVIQALETRGFTFEATAGAFVNSSGNTLSQSPTPSSEPTGTSTDVTPPSSISELQAHTFESLRRHNIQAHVDKSLRIVQCAAHYQEASTNVTPSVLRPGVIAALILDKPKFLSLTMTSTDPAASILLETRLLPRFSQLDPTDTFGQRSGNDIENDGNVLIGAKDDVLIPIIFDLRNLPLDATGIICGVASRLAAATQGRDNASATNDDKPVDAAAETEEKQQFRLEADPANAFKEPVEMSFLSTTLGGTCIVGVPELERAMESLQAEAENADRAA